MNLEIVHVIDSVSRDKNIPKEKLFSVVENAIASAGKKKYGSAHDIRTRIHRKTGDIKLFRVLKAVDQVNDPYTEILLTEALVTNPQLQPGDLIYDDLPIIDLTRTISKTVKQIIVEDINRIEKEQEYQDFINKLDTIVTATVRKIDHSATILEIEGSEAVLKADQKLRTDKFKVGDRIKVCIKTVNHTLYGAQIYVSRTSNMMLKQLLALEIPEIYSGQIEVKAIARDSGSKSKVAVFSSEHNIDPVGFCIGPKGRTIKNVMYELNGEKIDVILWSYDQAQFIINALSPAQVDKVVLNEETRTAVVIIRQDQLTMAIGKQGQNIKLASRLTDWRIKAMTAEEESKARVENFNKLTHNLVHNLNVEEVIAQLLIISGFMSAEQIAEAPINDLANIEGFDEEIGQELQNRALTYLDKKTAVIEELNELGFSRELMSLIQNNVNLNLDQIFLLATNGIKSLEDLGSIEYDEFSKFLPEHSLSEDAIVKLIQIAQKSIKLSNI